MSARKISGEYYNKKRCSSILNENVNNSFSSPTFSRNPLYKSYSEASPAKSVRHQKLMLKRSGVPQNYLSPDSSIIRRKSMKIGESTAGRYSQTGHGINRASSVHSSFPFCRPSYSDITQLKPSSLVQSMKMNSHIMRDRNEKNSVIRALQIMESKKRNFQEYDISDCGNNSLSDDLNSVPNSKRQRMISGSSNLDGMSSSSSVTQKDHIGKLSKQDTFCYTSMRDVSSDGTQSSFGLGGRQNFVPKLHSLSNGNSKCSSDTPELSRTSTPSDKQSHTNQSALDSADTVSECVGIPITKATIRRRISYMTPAQIESQLGNRSSAAVELMRFDNKHKRNVSRSAVTQTENNHPNDSIISVEKPLSVADLIANIDKNRKHESPLEKAVERKPGEKDDYMEKRLSRIRALIAKFSDNVPEPATNSFVFKSPVQSLASDGNPTVTRIQTVSPPALNSVLSTSQSASVNNLSNNSQLSQPMVKFTTTVASEPSTYGFSSTLPVSNATKLLSDIVASSSSTTSTKEIAAPTVISSSSSVPVLPTVPSALNVGQVASFSFGANAAKPAVLSFGQSNDKSVNKPFDPPSTSVITTSSAAIVFTTPSVSSVAFGSNKPIASQANNAFEPQSKGFSFGSATSASSTKTVFNITPSLPATTSSSVQAPSKTILDAKSISQTSTSSLFGPISKTTASVSSFPSIGSSNNSEKPLFSFGQKPVEQKSAFPSISTAPSSSPSLFSFSKSTNQEKKTTSSKEDNSNIFTKNIGSTPFNFGGNGHQSATTFGASATTSAAAAASTVLSNNSSSSIFGGNSQSQTTTSLFGGTTKPQSENTKTLFGNTDRPVAPTIFGSNNVAQTLNNNTSATKPTLFGANSQSASNSLFSFNNSTVSNSDNKPAGLFGNSDNSKSLFSGQQTKPTIQPNSSIIFGTTPDNKGLPAPVPLAAPQTNPTGGFNFSGNAPAAAPGGFNFSNNNPTSSNSSSFNFSGQPTIGQPNNVFNANPSSTPFAARRRPIRKR